jgi:hypothetical protein
MYLEAKNFGDRFIHSLGKLVEESVDKKNFAGIETPILAGLFLILAISTVILSIKLYRNGKQNKITHISSDTTRNTVPMTSITLNDNKTIELPLNSFFKIQYNEEYGTVEKDKVFNKKRTVSKIYFITQIDGQTKLIAIDNEGKKETLNNLVINSDSQNFTPLQALKFTPNNIRNNINATANNTEHYMLFSDNKKITGNAKKHDFLYLTKTADTIQTCDTAYLYKDPVNNFENWNISSTFEMPSQTNDIDTKTCYYLDYGKDRCTQQVHFSLTKTKENNNTFCVCSGQKTEIFPSNEQITQIKNQLQAPPKKPSPNLSDEQTTVGINPNKKNTKTKQRTHSSDSDN